MGLEYYQSLLVLSDVITVWCRFLESPKVVEVDVGRPAEIRCNVDAVPLTASTITWRREGYDLGKGGKLVMNFSSSCL
jgi:hypothetical protein